MNTDTDEHYTTLLEMDTFQVVKDEKFGGSRQRGQNNYAEHWIAHMCDAYRNSEDEHETATGLDETGVFDSEEIREGKCYYCKSKIPDPIVALWSLLEWESAGQVLHKETPRMYQVMNKPLVL